MKKLLVTALMSSAFFMANAQSDKTFRAFKFDISAGYALPMSNYTYGANGGFLLSFEPKYAVSDPISLGLRLETAISISGNDKVRGSGSYLATGDYYFSSDIIRPFVGVGVGIYTHASADINTSDEIKGSTRFGGAPRLGVEIAHFRAAVEYNFAGKVADVSKNYIGFKLGVLIGGGRIEN